MVASVERQFRVQLITNKLVAIQGVIEVIVPFPRVLNRRVQRAASDEIGRVGHGTLGVVAAVGGQRGGQLGVQSHPRKVDLAPKRFGRSKRRVPRVVAHSGRLVLGL